MQLQLQGTVIPIPPGQQRLWVVPPSCPQMAHLFQLLRQQAPVQVCAQAAASCSRSPHYSLRACLQVSTQLTAVKMCFGAFIDHVLVWVCCEPRTSQGGLGVEAKGMQAAAGRPLTPCASRQLPRARPAELL